MPSVVDLRSPVQSAVPRPDPVVAKHRENFRTLCAIRRRLVVVAGAAVLFGGIAVGVSRVTEIRYALGIGPFDAHLSIIDPEI